MWGDIVSSTIALCAFVLSLITYVRGEKEKKITALRQFLQDSLSHATQMYIWLAHFTMNADAGVIVNYVLPAYKEFYKLQPQSLRWCSEDFYTAFNSVLDAMGNLTGATEKLNNIPEDKDKSEARKEFYQAVIAVFNAASNYKTKAHDRLVVL
jgi:hypothetical protein